MEILGDILCNYKRPLKERFRALFSLRNINTIEAVDTIAKCFEDKSALLKHECAYCLGQMQQKHAIPILLNLLDNEKQEIIVRHEAAEALAAIGNSSEEVVSMLKKHVNSKHVDIVQTCQLALLKLDWLDSHTFDALNIQKSSFSSIDPAPPLDESFSFKELSNLLIDIEKPLFQRYRAMFTLRNMHSNESAIALTSGLECKDSALFRHEVAYVLGQMQNPLTVVALTKTLSNHKESGMVRHECAEALGSISTGECENILKTFLADPEILVKESCVVALDMVEYETSTQFNFLDTNNQ